MKKLILQTWTNDNQNWPRGMFHKARNNLMPDDERIEKTNMLKEASHISVKKYAEKYSIEYKLVENNNFFVNAVDQTIEKLRVFSEEYINYDQILVLDLDIIIKKDADNIFKYYIDDDCCGRLDNGCWINGGVILWSKKTLDRYRDLIYGMKEKPMNHGQADETVINYLVRNHDLNITSMDKRFNRYCKEYHFKREEAEFIHYREIDYEQTKLVLQSIKDGQI